MCQDYKNNKIFKYEAIVVGSGAAGFNTANNLKKNGIKKVAIVTENINYGTSRNTGSDKQTYYKLSLAGNNKDSVDLLANNLFNGGCVDGDNALCEASMSVECFMNLATLGVGFPKNLYGEYVGYKTDHDPFQRATSAGPLTSKMMTEVLEQESKKQGIKVYDNLLVVKVLVKNKKAIGLLCLDKLRCDYVFFNVANIVLATGGPACIYKNNVYPINHHGFSSLAIEAGAKFQNMTEWQYGLASINPKWNVSGSYMQVLPRFVSIDSQNKEHEFLLDYFKDPYKALNMIFLKGYQWPFDVNKVTDGSSIIDILVYKEIALKNRRVFLDYTKNGFNLEKIDYKKLSDESFTYLDSTNSFGLNPYIRLKKLNKPAIELYESKGINLKYEKLEIALCAQHNNGGIAVNNWWETSIKGLFAVGECAGTHGISRPGGSALNAGQVGGSRAALYISRYPNQNITDLEFKKMFNKILKEKEKLININGFSLNKIADIKNSILLNMSNFSGAIRDANKINLLLKENLKLIDKMDSLSVKFKKNLIHLYHLKDVIYTSSLVLYAIKDYINYGCQSRGSALYSDKFGKNTFGLDETFSFSIDRKHQDIIQEICYNNNVFKSNWRIVRKIPDRKDSFETIWKLYRKLNSK